MNKEDKLAAKLAKRAEKEQRKLEKKALKAQTRAERASSRSLSLPNAPSVASNASRRSGSSLDQESPGGREARDSSVVSVTGRSSSQSPGRAGSGSGEQRPHSLTVAGSIDTLSGESAMASRPASLSLPAGAVKIPGEKRKGLKFGAVPGMIPKFGLKKKKKKDTDGMSVISNESRMSMSMASVMIGDDHMGTGALEAFTSPDRSSSFAGSGMLTMQSFGSRGINNPDSSASEEEEYEPEEGGRDSSPGSRGRRSRSASRSPSPRKSRPQDPVSLREQSPTRKQSPIRRSTSADIDETKSVPGPSSNLATAGVVDRTSKSPSIDGTNGRPRESSPEARLRARSPGGSMPSMGRQDTAKSRDKSPASVSSRASLPPPGASPGQSREASPLSTRPSALASSSQSRDQSPSRKALQHEPGQDTISSPPRNLSKSLSLPDQQEEAKVSPDKTRPASMTLASPAVHQGLSRVNRSVSPGSGGSRPASMSLSTGMQHAEKEKKKGLKLVPAIPKFGLGKKKKKKEVDTMSVASNESIEAATGFNLPEAPEASSGHDRGHVSASPPPADVEIQTAPRNMDMSKSFESVGLDDDDDRHSVLSVENEGSVAGDRGRAKKRRGIGSITRRASSLLKPPGQVKKLLHLPGNKARAPSVDAALALPSATSQSPERHEEMSEPEAPEATRKVSVSAPSSPQGKRKAVSPRTRWGSMDEKVISEALLKKEKSPVRVGSASPPGLPVGPPRERSQTTVVTSGSSLVEPETRSERSASCSPKSNRNISLSGSLGDSNASVIVRDNPTIVAQQAQDLRDQIEERKAQLAKMKTSLIGGGKKKKMKKELKKKELPELLERLQALENLKAQYAGGDAPVEDSTEKQENDGMTNVVLTPTEDNNVNLEAGNDGVSPDSVKAPVDSSPSHEKALIDAESMDMAKRKKSGIMGLGKGLMVSPRRASKALLKNAVLHPKQAINPKAFIKGATDQMEVEKERQHERAQSVDRTRSVTMADVPHRRATSVQPGTRLSKAEKKELKREKKEEKKQLKRERKESKALELQMKRSASKEPAKNKELLLPPTTMPSDIPAPKDPTSEVSDEESDGQGPVSPRGRDTRAATMAAVAQPTKRDVDARGRSRSLKRAGSTGSPKVSSPKFHSEPRHRSVTRLDRDVDPSHEVPLLVRFPTNIQAQVFDENATRAAEWTFDDGTKYQGDWAHGAPNGEGQLVQVDGSRYKGGLKDGMKEGKGEFLSTVGQQYVGEWVCGKRHGYGVQTESDESSRTVAEYRGEWENDVPHGNGEEYHKNGDVFRGTWVNGRKSAEGTFTYASGACFTGVWEDGKLVSAGAFTCPSGPFVSSPGPNDRPVETSIGSPGSPISVR